MVSMISWFWLKFDWNQKQQQQQQPYLSQQLADDTMNGVKIDSNCFINGMLLPLFTTIGQW